MRQPQGDKHVIGRNRVVITGIGVLAANGIGKEAFWNSLLAGESGIGPITHFDASEIQWQLAGEVSNFDSQDHLEARFKSRRESRATQLAAVAAKMALEDANLHQRQLSQSAPLLITIGSTLSGLDLVETHNRRIESKGINKGLVTVSSCLHIKTPRVIANYIDVPTQIETISNSCTAGLDSIASASDAVRKGQFDVAIAGGTDAGIIPSVVTGLGFAGLLSTNSQNPNNASRPFDMLRTGGYLGEGAGIVVLETLEHALSRGAKPYAEVLGFNTTSDYSNMNCFGYELSMQRAIMNSGCLPSDISMISAHGSSSIELDEIETLAIKRLFREHAYKIPVTSIKGATGNPLAGGAVMQAISVMLTFRHRIVAPTTNYETPDPMCDLDYVGGSPRQQHVSSALINSRGIGGVNSSLVLRNLD